MPWSGGRTSQHSTAVWQDYVKAEKDPELAVFVLTAFLPQCQDVMHEPRECTVQFAINAQGLSRDLAVPACIERDEIQRALNVMRHALFKCTLLAAVVPSIVIGWDDAACSTKAGILSKV